MSSWARDQEGAGRERHDQNAGGRGTDVHFVSAAESVGYLSICHFTSWQCWVWLFLLLLQRPDGPGNSSWRLISLLRLQPLQQALQWETLTEMETSMDFVTGLSYSRSSEHSTSWSDETRSSDTVSAHVATWSKQRPPALQLYGCQHRFLKKHDGLKFSDLHSSVQNKIKIVFCFLL